MGELHLEIIVDRLKREFKARLFATLALLGLVLHPSPPSALAFTGRISLPT